LERALPDGQEESAVDLGGRTHVLRVVLRRK